LLSTYSQQIDDFVKKGEITNGVVIVTVRKGKQGRQSVLQLTATRMRKPVRLGTRNYLDDSTAQELGMYDCRTVILPVRGGSATPRDRVIGLIEK